MPAKEWSAPVVVLTLVLNVLIYLFFLGLVFPTCLFRSALNGLRVDPILERAMMVAWWAFAAWASVNHTVTYMQNNSRTTHFRASIRPSILTFACVTGVCALLIIGAGLHLSFLDMVLVFITGLLINAIFAFQVRRSFLRLCETEGGGGFEVLPIRRPMPLDPSSEGSPRQ
jgi:hypothetical protein